MHSLLISLLFITSISGLVVYDAYHANGTLVLEGFQQDSPSVDRYPNNFQEFYAAVVFPGVPRAFQFPFVTTIDGQDVLVNKFVTIANSVGTNQSIDALVLELATSGQYDGILMLETIAPATAGYLNYIWYGAVDHSKVEIPVVATNFFTGIAFFEALTELNFTAPLVVKISATDENKWKTVFESLWMQFWVLIVVPFSLFNFYMATKKFIITLNRDELKLNIGQVTLISLAVANLFRAFLFFIDPLFKNQIIPFELSTILVTIHFPLEQMTTTLLAFYWVTLMDKNDVGVKTFLGWLSVPFIIIVVFLFGQELVTGILRAYSSALDTGFFIQLSAIFYMIFNIGIGIFFFYNGYKVIKLTESGGNSTFYKKLRKITISIMTAGIFIIVWLIPLSVAAFFPFIFFDPVGNTVTWFFLLVILLITSYLEIQAITLPPKKISSSTRSRNNR